MLGFESRFEVHAFLKQHNTYLNYTISSTTSQWFAAYRVGWSSLRTVRLSTTSFSSMFMGTLGVLDKAAALQPD
jgi:hypothetical protein